jgi:hypothetical protein
MPFFAGLSERADEFLLFRIDADHGVAGGEELLGPLVDVPELVVPVRVLASLQCLAGSL